MSLWVKSVLMWLVLLAAMMVNGVFRVLVLQPRLGEHLARQAACLSGVCVILALSAPFVKRLGHVGSRKLLGVGLLWLLLTVAFEFLFGHYVAGATWDALLAEYEVFHGRLWPFALLVTFGAPWFWGALRSQRAYVSAQERKQ